MLLKNLIKDSPKRLEKLKIKGLALNSKNVKKGFTYNSSNNPDFLSIKDLKKFFYH